MQFALLDEFRRRFEGQPYLHRNSTHGDAIARVLGEDLFTLGVSPKFTERVANQTVVLDPKNRTRGRAHRRGDAAIGRAIPGAAVKASPGFHVAHGELAQIEVGVEVKILAKAMIKQIDRLMNDVRHQAEEFKKSSPYAITVAIIGVNHAEPYLSFEGERTFLTKGDARYRHPSQEAPEAIRRLESLRDAYDEFLLLSFRATNIDPHPFEWLDAQRMASDYSAALVRIGTEYERRF